MMETVAERLRGLDTATRRAVSLRVLRKVEMRDGDDCWPWSGATINGYGVTMVLGRQVMATHAVLAVLGRPVPAGFDVHHDQCRTRRCVRPDHIVVVSKADHDRFHAEERIAARTHCRHGHALIESNTRIERRGTRACRECSRVEQRARRSRLKGPDPIWG